MILAKTFSRDVVEFIGKEHLVENLKRRPRLLLKFFIQAVQSYSFYKQSHELLNKTASSLLCLIRSEILPWNTVYKTIDVICRYYSPMIVKSLPDGISQRTHLIPLMMRNCKPLREKWLDQQTAVLDDKSLRTHIDKGELEILLESCITENFSFFRSYSITRLRSSILQCRVWGWQKGEEAFEEIYTERVNDARSAVLALYYAHLHGFQKLFTKAVEVLGNLEFLISISSKGFPCYTQLSVGNPLNAVNIYQSFEQRKQNDDIALKHHRRRNEHLQALGIYGSNNILNFNVLSEQEDLDDIRALYATADKCSMPRNKIKHLSFDEKHSPSFEFFLGMLVYFEEVTEIEILNYNVSIPFLKEISRIRPGARFLKFSHCENVNADLIANLPALFPDLKSLYFEGIKLHQSVFSVINKFMQLDQIYFDSCHFSLPEELSIFPRLASLAVSHMVLSATEASRLWQSCPNVEDICVVGLEGFDPRSYPYPGKIKNVSAKSLDFNRWIENEELILIKLFPNLMSLNVYGNEYSGRLARELIRMRKETSIAIEFRECK